MNSSTKGRLFRTARIVLGQLGKKRGPASNFATRVMGPSLNSGLGLSSTQNVCLSTRRFLFEGQPKRR